MAIRLVYQFPFGGKLVYLTGGAYELHMKTGNVLIHKCTRKSKSNDKIAYDKAREYLSREVFIYKC